MIPSSSELRYFVEISHTLNISRAAERLGISQPTLTLAVQKLESSMGVPLLVRTKTGVKLTQAGQKLASQARVLLHEWERIRNDAIKNEQEVTGRYIIGCHPSVALYCLPSILPKLLGEHPSLEVKLVHDLSRKIAEDVISFKVDFGIVVNPWQHPDLVIKPLFNDVVTLWVSQKPCDLDVLICDPELIQTQAILKELSKKGLTFARTVTSSSLELITALVASRAGIGILPTRVATLTESLGLKVLNANSPKFHDRICLIYRADAQRSKASRTVAKLMERYISPGPFLT